MQPFRLAAVLLLLSFSMAHADTITLYAAGSLKTALSEVARAYESATGDKVEAEFGPSGLLRERIEKGAPAHVFASANMKHPQTLQSQGKGGPVALFARNRLCALARPGVTVTPATLLDALLDPNVRLGTSTPKADPSGDYAWELFRKADAIKPGAFAALDEKALQLTGGPNSEKAPEGRNQYGWVMDTDKADIFLTYCTNAVLAKKDVPGLKIVAVPSELSVGADYGLIVLDGAPPAAWRLALYILAPEGQTVLAEHGFDAGAIPTR